MIAARLPGCAAAASRREPRPLLKQQQPVCQRQRTSCDEGGVLAQAVTGGEGGTGAQAAGLDSGGERGEADRKYGRLGEAGIAQALRRSLEAESGQRVAEDAVRGLEDAPRRR